VKKLIHNRLAQLAFVMVATTAILTACSDTGSNTGNSQGELQSLSEQIFQKANKQAAQDYVNRLNGATAEVKNVQARDIRLMDPNKIGYVYHFTNDGKLLEYYTIRGKMSSTASQLTNSQNVITQSALRSNGGNVVTDSIGDDGTYNAEECGTAGVFFFRADNDAIVTMCGGIITYSDAPLTLTSQPVVIVQADQKVTTDIPQGGSTK
jgi:hypothetical protein